MSVSFPAKKDKSILSYFRFTKRIFVLIFQNQKEGNVRGKGISISMRDWMVTETKLASILLLKR